MSINNTEIVNILKEIFINNIATTNYTQDFNSLKNTKKKNKNDTGNNSEIAYNYTFIESFLK